LAFIVNGVSDTRRIKELEVMVADVIVEAPDTTTLVLFTGNDRLEYSAGHFLTIDPHQFEALERFTSFLEDLKGKREPPRAYSMSSSPHERYLGGHGEGGAVRLRDDQVSAAAVAAARQTHDAWHASRGDRLHRTVHAARPT
jgi:ferredoxin-NADP reductase